MKNENRRTDYAINLTLIIFFLISVIFLLIGYSLVIFFDDTDWFMFCMFIIFISTPFNIMLNIIEYFIFQKSIVDKKKIQRNIFIFIVLDICVLIIAIYLVSIWTSILSI
jgi:hypothetical protein